LHIERCIKSLRPISKDIFIVDSNSTDQTVDICESLGAKVFQNSWVNYAEQFQWGLEHCPIKTEWVMRMDADEYIEADLIDELSKVLPLAEKNTTGFYIRRKYFFLGQWIKKGAVYPLHLLRVWRVGQGRIENRWMDEHIILSSPAVTKQLDGHIVDDNLNNTSWWTQKHNAYADREMIDILDKKYNFFQTDDALKVNDEGSQAKIKRKLKENIYNKFPVFVRPLLYFLYRYFIRLGFLDGKRGFAFHFFQGYWYRSLVDLRVYEAELLLKNSQTNEQRISLLKAFTGLKL
jgi:glycosyltransferase involved in cell wall biosynthesis